MHIQIQIRQFNLLEAFYLEYRIPTSYLYHHFFLFTPSANRPQIPAIRLISPTFTSHKLNQPKGCACGRGAIWPAAQNNKGIQITKG